MITYNVFPGGKNRVVTFSYDDGAKEDKRLIELFDKYNVKATFHLNGNKYIGMSDAELADVRELYKGHEISCHTLSHCWPAYMPMQSVASEVMEDRKVLEKIALYPVVGMSYPYGSYSDESIAAMKVCGIVYSRTVDSTNGFRMPEDFMKWHPTCHHKNAMEPCKRFIELIDSPHYHPMFYIWGHSYEFKTEADWEYMENLVSVLSGRENVWYATNIEIYNYVQAQKNLQISADETVFYNPSHIPVWIEKNREQIIKIGAGETVKL